MSISEPIKQFNQWIQSFNYQILENVDDVKNRFILPMFQYLGYPNKCLKSKFTVSKYASSINSANLEINKIYLHSDVIELNNTDTAIVIIDIKNPRETNLSPAIVESSLASISVKPLFLIITNGYEIQVFQYWRYRPLHCLFDITVETLKKQEIAIDFYQTLNFLYVSSINKNLDNLFTFKHHNLLEKHLRRYAYWQDLLNQTDFQPEITQKGNQLIVVKPKVAIKCNLPQAFSEGDCEIEFSNIMFRGIKISINHRQILDNLMIGLNTQPHWQCRPFIKQVDKNIFEAVLGETTIILSELETIDLCLCIDEICQEYKKSIIEFENNLETWEFEFIEVAGIRGFKICDVEPKLWELMYKFAHEFTYYKGKSAWHLFNHENFSIRLSRGIRDHVLITPKASSYCSLLPYTKISIIYTINAIHLQPLDKKEQNYWQRNIGTQGTWTAKYTKKWLLEQYIPKVINYYSQQNQFSINDIVSAIKKSQPERSTIVAIDDIKNLLPYLKDIQSWFNLYRENIAATILRLYYRTFTDLVRNTDSSINGMDYLTANLQRIDWQNSQGLVDSRISQYKKFSSFKNAINCLDEQVTRINNHDYEKSLNADSITRIFIWIIENGKISYSQPQMNAAKQALLPLWEECRFEMRHVFSYK
ncbi:hypothetical protein H6G41_01585 [Tolypothrix sp. FACHB-123]|uniref:hypothetical protein n=1 Tax=Tolypothrix sp. FACHB-123 TaxID=2692868 RepID=UPI0016862D58|nr:hypothetical protein [Tolypothrix sp. FACHB-123]MBD2353323.1 hypothetical protein [Tolypothrix sp. FACHB-123]